MLSAFAAEVALSDETFILSTGRRDPRIYSIDFDAALKSRNNTSNATNGTDHAYLEPKVAIQPARSYCARERDGRTWMR